MRTITSIMNWPVNRLLLSASVLLALFSCEEPKDIGLDIQPASQVGVHSIDFAALQSGTVLLDSVSSKGNTVLLQHPVGYLNDPYFGKVTAETYTEIRLKNQNVQFNSSATLESVVLHLGYKGAYGQTDVPFTFTVHELTENILDTSYYAFSTMPYSSDQISVEPKTFVPDTYNDTLKRKRVFLQVPLTAEFGNRILALSATDLKDQSAFRQKIKGLAIVPDVNTNKAISTFDFSGDADSSYVELKYKEGTAEPKSLKFYLDKTTKRFHSVKSDRSASVLASAITTRATVYTPAQTQNETLIQGIIGLRTKISFPGLDTLRNHLGKEIAINKAELIIPVVGGTTQTYAPPLRLILTESTAGNRIYVKNNQEQYIGTDANPSPLNFQQILFNNNKYQYEAQLGSYVQSVIYGRKPNNGLLLYDLSNAVEVNRVRLLPAGINGMRLKIYYTKIG